jgi:hypothetical protein
MDHFQTHGWVRIPGAFSADEAAAMRDVVWHALAPLLLHAPPTTHLGRTPRFLLNKDIYL